ncbi:MAG: hypothetical protein RLZZ419_173, partial [Pseudomonadota bacterium]|jgi:hypothetical protein
MKKIKYLLVLVVIISGCNDMKMDRKVMKQMTLVESVGLSVLV